MSGLGDATIDTWPCAICHRPTHVGRVLCWRCAKVPDGQHEPKTEWGRARKAAREATPAFFVQGGKEP